MKVPPDVVPLELLQYVGPQGHDLLFVLVGVQIVFGLADSGVRALCANDRVTVEARNDEVVVPPDEGHSHRLDHPTGYVAGECGLAGVLAADEQQAHGYFSSPFSYLSNGGGETSAQAIVTLTLGQRPRPC